MELQPSAAQELGTNLRAAMRVPELKKWLFLRLVTLSERVDAGKRLQTQGEYQEAVEEILAAVPALTLEEIEIVFRKFERGDIEIFNRLRIPEILKALLHYDATTAQELREYRNTQHRLSDLLDYDRIAQTRESSFLCLTEEDLIEIGKAEAKR